MKNNFGIFSKVLAGFLNLIVSVPVMEVSLSPSIWSDLSPLHTLIMRANMDAPRETLERGFETLSTIVSSLHEQSHVLTAEFDKLKALIMSLYLSLAGNKTRFGVGGLLAHPPLPLRQTLIPSRSSLWLICLSNHLCSP